MEIDVVKMQTITPYNYYNYFDFTINLQKKEEGNYFTFSFAHHTFFTMKSFHDTPSDISSRPVGTYVISVLVTWARLRQILTGSSTNDTWLW